MATCVRKLRTRLLLSAVHSHYQKSEVVFKEEAIPFDRTAAKDI